MIFSYGRAAKDVSFQPKHILAAPLFDKYFKSSIIILGDKFMGTEYYLVKPEKREIFYLGKHMVCPRGITDGSYSDVLRNFKVKSSPIDYDCWEDFFWDFLRENSYCFEDFTLEQSKEIIYSVYEWCSDGDIYFDHDCHMDKVEWLEWKETGSLIELFEKLNNSIYN